MTVLLSRRGVLRCLTGIIAAPAVVKADALMRVVAPKIIDPFGNEFESYVSHFRMASAWVPLDWKHAVKIARISNVSVLIHPNELLPRSPAAHERA